MSVTWVCDICGKQTFINPPVEFLTEEKEFKTKDEKGKTKKIKQTVPKMATMKRQNSQTGKIEDVPIQDMKDLKPRTYIVRLEIGRELIQKDFCKECLGKVLPEIKQLWNKLESIKSK